MIYNRPETIYFDQAKSFLSTATGLVEANRPRVEPQPLNAVVKAPSTPTPVVDTKPALATLPTPPTSTAVEATPTTPSSLVCYSERIESFSLFNCLFFHPEEKEKEEEEEEAKGCRWPSKEFL